jgi:DNA-binding GntR family transcriptional regulator
MDDPEGIDAALDGAEEAPKRLVKLSQLAYQRFKQKLFAQQIEVGATITQADLVSLLDVPIGPLREALQLLENEGLVTMLPRSGIRIVKPDLNLIRNSYQLRRILEVEAVRKFIERASAEELETWESRHRAMIEAGRMAEAEAELVEAARALDTEFHAALIASLRNPLIADVYDKTKDRIRLIRLDTHYMFSVVTVVQTLQEHLRVLAALRARDTDGAVAAMEDHLARSLHRAIGF